MKKILPKKFYNRPPDIVAKDLLGKILMHKINGVCCSGRIVEVEAYLAENDPACHAACGKTNRNNVMFGPPGMAYVYFCYGNHWLVNAVTEDDGVPSAVLIRALEPVTGLETMRYRRNVKEDKNLTNGPAKLCEALGISGAQNSVPLFKGNLLIFDDGRKIPEFKSSSRIGIKEGCEHQLRFFVSGNKYISAKPKD